MHCLYYGPADCVRAPHYKLLIKKKKNKKFSYRGVPCNSLESLWKALDGSYNAATARPVNLSFLHPVPPMPLREWVPFSSLELSEALAACAHNSSPGPDHVTWSYLKYWCGSKGVASLFTCVANVCICAGH
jgi:hypothetical protein